MTNYHFGPKSVKSPSLIISYHLSIQFLYDWTWKTFQSLCDWNRSRSCVTGLKHSRVQSRVFVTGPTLRSTRVWVSLVPIPHSYFLPRFSPASLWLGLTILVFVKVSVWKLVSNLLALFGESVKSVLPYPLTLKASIRHWLTVTFHGQIGAGIENLWRVVYAIFDIHKNLPSINAGSENIWFVGLTLKLWALEGDIQTLIIYIDMPLFICSCGVTPGLDFFCLPVTVQNT